MKENENSKENFSLLSDVRVLEHISQGNIIIDPFKRENLGTTSYDVSLGKYYFREQTPNPGHSIYSLWSEEEINRVWGKPQEAVCAGKYMKEVGLDLPKGIRPEDEIILIPPQETFLCHTQEFIGGRNCVTTMMKARSSLGRNFIEVCKCAGWGDVGYINRWTMEITNNSKNYTIPLVVGRRVAQIAFFEVGKVEGIDYSKFGKYQNTEDTKSLKKKWTPYQMLPKMWRDREVNSFAPASRK